MAIVESLPRIVLDPKPSMVEIEPVNYPTVAMPEAERPRQEPLAWVAVSIPTTQVARVEHDVEVTLDGEPSQAEAKSPSAEVSAVTQSRVPEIVRMAILRHLQYPEASRRRGEEGTVRLRLRIGEGGDLLNVEVAGDSARLAEAARRAALAAAPFTGVGDCIVEVPIAFRLTP